MRWGEIFYTTTWEEICVSVTLTCHFLPQNKYIKKSENHQAISGIQGVLVVIETSSVLNGVVVV